MGQTQGEVNQSAFKSDRWSGVSAKLQYLDIFHRVQSDLFIFFKATDDASSELTNLVNVSIEQFFFLILPISPLIEFLFLI